jgi:hypothetical protein
MKAISASIIVLSGAIVFAAGALTNHGDTQLFVCSAGGLLAIIGFCAWIAACSGKE